ncbi:hypothetical protein GMST_05050 [Geomonas silvestris]|uniref:Uncharacterized protein n=1 Tax=Geomonas silvestris TaxID=2740184 RepID=A0A6V8MDW7_9BACT|nr:hypothetical protein GMST_05050 [Geomonas silvestris]
MINKDIPLGSIFPSMGLVIQFHHSEDSKVGGRTYHKVNVLLVHLVQGAGTPTVGQPLRRFDEIAETDLSKDPVVVGQSLFEHPEE